MVSSKKRTKRDIEYRVRQSQKAVQVLNSVQQKDAVNQHDNLQSNGKESRVLIYRAECWQMTEKRKKK